VKRILPQVRQPTKRVTNSIKLCNKEPYASIDAEVVAAKFPKQNSIKLA
jgi:hypothetical protein